MATPGWGDEACEDLRGIRQSWVRAQILDLGNRDLEESPEEGPLTGAVAGLPGMWWRRALERSEFNRFTAFDLEEEEEASQSCDYVLVYRRITDDEAINLKRPRGGLIVVRVCHNSEIAKWI